MQAFQEYFSEGEHFQDKDDFALSWEEVLDSDEQISTFTAAVITASGTSTLIIESSSFVGPITTVRVAGGSVGLGRLRYTITTTKGRILNTDVSFRIHRGNL